LFNKIINGFDKNQSRFFELILTKNIKRVKYYYKCCIKNISVGAMLKVLMEANL